MTVTAVIGANYGDEGKGLLTDYLCAGHPRSLVVRFNGGAQAGHTVVTPEGRRHTFSHFGSGTFAGAETYLSRFFLVNPLLWRPEFEKLGRPWLLVHPCAPLSTPYDMMFNRALERARGNERHGSCGYGIWETELRCRSGVYTQVKDITARGFYNLLSAVKEYFEHRARKLDLILQKDWVPETLVKDYLSTCRAFVTHCRFYGQIPYDDNVVFEGAQGLLLDEHNQDNFPYVTGSRTGLDNVKVLCQESDLKLDEAIYVTRSYMTRHGAGPFPTEWDKTFPDATNVPNEWQGTLRFGKLDPISFLDRTTTDAGKMGLAPSMAITCLDQYYPWNNDGLHPVYKSFGPTRAHITRSLES